MESYGLTKEVSENYILVSMFTLERRNYTTSVFVNLQRAFETISHEVLLEKLNFYGVGETVFELVV